MIEVGQKYKVLDAYSACINDNYLNGDIFEVSRVVDGVGINDATGKAINTSDIDNKRLSLIEAQNVPPIRVGQKYRLNNVSKMHLDGFYFNGDRVIIERVGIDRGYWGPKGFSECYIETEWIDAGWATLVEPEIHKTAQSESSVSDGSTASYYKLPVGATELQHLISAKNMNSQIGEIFRSTYRYGQASHSDQLRDAKKIKFYIEQEIARIEQELAGGWEYAE